MDKQSGKKCWNSHQNCRVAPSHGHPPFEALLALAHHLYTRDIHTLIPATSWGNHREWAHHELRHILCVVCLISSCVEFSMISKEFRTTSMGTSRDRSTNKLSNPWEISWLWAHDEFNNTVVELSLRGVFDCEFNYPKPIPWLRLPLLLPRLWTEFADFPNQLPLCWHGAANRGDFVRSCVRSGVKWINLSAFLKNSWKRNGHLEACRTPLFAHLFFHMNPFFPMVFKAQNWKQSYYRQDLRTAPHSQHARFDVSTISILFLNICQNVKNHEDCTDQNERGVMFTMNTDVFDMLAHVKKWWS